MKFENINLNFSPLVTSELGFLYLKLQIFITWSIFNWLRGDQWMVLAISPFEKGNQLFSRFWQSVLVGSLYRYIIRWKKVWLKRKRSEWVRRKKRKTFDYVCQKVQFAPPLQQRIRMVLIRVLSRKRIYTHIHAGDWSDFSWFHHMFEGWFCGRVRGK